MFNLRSLVRFVPPTLHLLQIDAFFHHLVEWGKFAQAFSRLDDAIDNVVDFRFGIEASDSEANRAVRQIVARTQGLQYIRWLQRRRRARRSAGNCDVIDAHQQRFTLDIGKAYVQIAR